MSHEDRIRAIRERASARRYITDGPVALYHALHELNAKGLDTVLGAALTEVERLYELQDRWTE